MRPWHMSVITAVESQSQETKESTVILGYIMRLKLAWIMQDTVTKQNYRHDMKLYFL